MELQGERIWTASSERNLGPLQLADKILIKLCVIRGSEALGLLATFVFLLFPDLALSVFLVRFTMILSLLSPLPSDSSWAYGLSLLY